MFSRCNENAGVMVYAYWSCRVTTFILNVLSVLKGKSRLRLSRLELITQVTYVVSQAAVTFRQAQPHSVTAF